ncbi:heterodisulfide reductase-related iron-sulfur binding cluster [Pedococcus sp. KACC 23699]|uniref:Glycolate oxidase iron-sulfur subunit n=1 Tax=Pedococcus sp. KACC 23699 TaxID=3149228 RepID=A0AAU7JRF8_9MICO
MTSTTNPSAPGGPIDPDGVGGFDAHRPPSQELLADCVHCGFCLPSCPTYVLWGEEMDSPRGRIHLMSQVREGEPLTPEVVGHFDACLGCMGCVTACPSGVKYDELITATRAQVERNTTRPPAQRFLRSAIFAFFPYPRRLRALRGPLRLHQRSGLSRVLRRSGVLQRISPHLAAMESLAPPLGAAESVPEATRARGPKRGTVGMLLGCVQREFFPGVNAATARVLAAEGFDVLAPSGQGCCGALSAHNGREPEAAAFARRLIDTFETAGVEHVVVNSAGCGSSMKEYAALLAGDPTYAARAEAFEEKVRDVSEFLAEVEPVATRHPLPVSVAYHDACHLGHAQGIRSQPRQLLGAIPGLDVREVPDGSLCCGSAGIYNLLNPDTARELGDRKAANVQRTGAELLVTANPGCLMQIHSALERAGTALPLAHTIEVLDASIRGRRPEDLGVSGSAPTSGRPATT